MRYLLNRVSYSADVQSTSLIVGVWTASSMCSRGSSATTGSWASSSSVRPLAEYELPKCADFAVVAGQILIVEVGGAAFTVTRLHGREWGISVVIGFLSIPIGALVRLCPTEPIERFLVAHHLYPDPSKLPTTAPEAVQEKYEYNPALSKIKDNLSTYANIRGGRLRASSIVAKSRSAQLKEADITLPNLLTMVPTLIGGAIG